MSETIGIGFIGAGGNTKWRHLPGFAAIKGVRLVTVANRSEASSRRVAEAFGIEKVAGNWKEVIADPEVDAVCIGTWPYMHAEVTVAALKAGKHVLTEARMAADLAGARAMVKAAEACPDRVAQVVPSPFTLDLDQAVMEILQNNTLGAIREIFINHATGAYLDPDAPLTWRQDSRYSGHNLLTLGIYHEVIQRWFAEPFTVLGALAGTFTKERVHWESGQRMTVQLPDALHALGRMGGHTLLNYHFSGIETSRGQNEIRLVGSEGSLFLDVGKGTLYQSTRGGGFVTINVPLEKQRGWRVEADFVESIRNGTPVRLTSFADGLRYMAFTEAVYTCIQEG